MTGIAAYGAYVPITRLPLSLSAGRPAKEGGAERAVADYDEDAVTMAVAAAIDCLSGIARENVDAVYFASTTYPLREKQGAALIAKARGLLEKSGRSVEDFAKVALYTPDERSAGGVLQRLGFKDQQVQNALFGRLGNTGTPFALMLLASALEAARPGDRLLVAA